MPNLPWAQRAQGGRGAYLRVMTALAAAAMALIFLIAILQVFCRYFLGAPLVWAEELARFILIWICFFFAGVAFARGEMVAIDLLTSVLRPRARALVMVPAYLVVVGFLAIIVYHGTIYATQNYIQTLPGIDQLVKSLTGSEAGLSIFWMYVSVPIGCTLLGLHMLAAAARVAREAFDRSARDGAGA